MLEGFTDHLSILDRHLVQHTDLQRPGKVVSPVQLSAQSQNPARRENGSQFLVGMGPPQIAGGLDP